MTKTKRSKTRRTAEAAAETTKLTHQQLALEALGCALNGMNRVAESWYLTAARKAEIVGDVEVGAEYRESARQQAVAAGRRSQ